MFDHLTRLLRIIIFFLPFHLEHENVLILPVEYYILLLRGT